MFLDPLIKAIRAPFDALRSTIFGVKNVPAGLKGDVNRLKALGGEMKGEAQGGLAQAQAARGKLASGRDAVKGGAASQQKVKMGLFAKKKKCPACGRKLHVTWDQCPYCGARDGEPAPAAGSAAKARTMAIDVGGAAPAGTSLGWLVPLEGPQIGEVFTLKGRAVVGTAPDCDVVLVDPSISSRHAEFIAGGGGFRMNDLGSTNGSYVNDQRVTTHDLVDNDNVRLGRTNFRFKAIG